MVRDISGLGSPNRNDLRTDRNSGGPKAESSASSTNAPANAPASAGDQVELSTQVQTLKKLEAQLTDLPDVDEERVAAIKSAIENGEYQINDQKIAEKLLSSDALFGK